MIEIGKWNQLLVLREMSQGFYLDDGADGILLPKKYAPPSLAAGQSIQVFIYKDKSNRLIATTLNPKGQVGDFVVLKAVQSGPQGAFLDFGISKDLFVPISKQINGMKEGYSYLVKIYLDELTGRLCGTEQLDPFLSNQELTVREKQEVDLIVYRKTPLGYMVIVNYIHLGLVFQNEVFQKLTIGDRLNGFVKKIHDDKKLDIGLGKIGFQRVETEAVKILQALENENGFLPLTDKSSPEAIYSMLEMSKKTFKMTVGNLYRERKINLEPNGIRLLS
jgi:uncharacterized protein